MKVHELKALLEGYHPDLDVVVNDGHGGPYVADILPTVDFTTGNPYDPISAIYDRKVDTPVLVLNLSIDSPYEV
jgi:hypothetical protein